MVRTVVARVLRRDGVSLLPDRDDMAAERTRLTALRRRQEEIASEYAILSLTGAQFKIANERLAAEIKTLEAEIGRRSAGSVLAGIADAPDPGATFLELVDIERQRAIIDVVVKVTVMPLGRGRHFVPESVQVEPIEIGSR
jgi:hypothetical protein